MSGSKNVTTNLGHSYERHSLWPLQNGQLYSIKEMEVLWVTAGTTINSTPKEKTKPSPKKSKVNEVEKFSKEVNSAINDNWMALEPKKNCSPLKKDSRMKEQLRPSLLRVDPKTSPLSMSAEQL